jgi:hypothetical protein
MVVLLPPDEVTVLLDLELDLDLFILELDLLIDLDLLLDLDLGPLAVGAELPLEGNPPIFEALPPILSVFTSLDTLVLFMATGLPPGPPTFCSPPVLIVLVSAYLDTLALFMGLATGRPAVGSPPVLIVLVSAYLDTLALFMAMGLPPGPPTVGSLSSSTSV